MPTKENNATAKRKYVKPSITEVWNENIGLEGAYLLEM